MGNSVVTNSVAPADNAAAICNESTAESPNLQAVERGIVEDTLRIGPNCNSVEEIVVEGEFAFPIKVRGLGKDFESDKETGDKFTIWIVKNGYASWALSPEPRAAVMSTPESTNVRILSVTGFQFVNSAATFSNLTAKLFVIEQRDTRFDNGGARRSQPATKFGSRLEFA